MNMSDSSKLTPIKASPAGLDPSLTPSSEGVPVAGKIYLARARPNDRVKNPYLFTIELEDPPSPRYARGYVQVKRGEQPWKDGKALKVRLVTLTPVTIYEIAPRTRGPLRRGES